MSPMRVLIKSGGAALESDESIAAICQAVKTLRSEQMEVVLVHGGGKAINRELERRGITWEFIEGQRKTTPEMMDVIESTLYGVVNRNLVGALQTSGIRAVGLSGGEAQTLQCTQADPRLGQVGKIENVSVHQIEAALKAGAVPVVAPLGAGFESGHFKTFNVNADWAASKVASAIEADLLVFLTDQPGVLDASGVALTQLNTDETQNLISEGTIQGGMLAKMRAIMAALKSGVKMVGVGHALEANQVIDGKSGTWLKADTAQDPGLVCVAGTQVEGKEGIHAEAR